VLTIHPFARSACGAVLPLLLAFALIFVVLPALGQSPSQEEAELGLRAAPQALIAQMSELIIPVLAIVMVFGMPALTVILLAVYIFRHKERQMRLYNERLQRFLEAGQPIPESLLKAEVTTATPVQHLNIGLILLGLGIGLAICLGVLVSWKFATIGLIPFAIGVGKMISWKMAARQP